MLCQSTIHLTKNQIYHERTKHIDVRMHFIRDVLVENISTFDNPTYVITKVLPSLKFKRCLDLVGVTNVT